MPPLNNRYPIIALRSKNEIVKRIASKKFPRERALRLINDVQKNHSRYWHDVESCSDPENGKFVRSCKSTPLGFLLKLIDRRILAPYDKMIPNFIFGGVSKRNHVQAAYRHLGIRRKRIKLSLDISRFFEQNRYERVFYLFYKKCRCTLKASKILADLCCVPLGPKKDVAKERVLARGFATSPRLALWCNLDLFLKVYREAKKALPNKDARITIFVDDIGISASRVTESEMELLSKRIEKILENHDKNQTLPLNPKKKQITSYFSNNMEHLGIKIGRNKLTPGKKTIIKQNIIYKKLKKEGITLLDRKELINKKKSYKNYKRYVESITKNKSLTF